MQRLGAGRAAWSWPVTGNLFLALGSCAEPLFFWRKKTHLILCIYVYFPPLTRWVRLLSATECFGTKACTNALLQHWVNSCWGYSECFWGTALGLSLGVAGVGH